MNEEDKSLKEAEAGDSNAMEAMLNAAEVPAEEIETHEQEPKSEETQVPAEETPVEPKAGDEQKPEGDKPTGEADTEEERAAAAKEAEEKAEKETEEKAKLEKKDDFDEEVDKIHLRKDASDRTKESFDTLKKKAKAEHAARVEAEKLLKEKEGIETVTPELKTELEELKRFKETFDIENDPKFTAQFNQALDNADNHGMTLLKSWNLPDSASKYIKDNGGLLKFRYSNEFMPQNFKNADGTRMTRQQWFDHTIMEKLEPQRKDEINDVLAFLRNTTRQKEQTINQVKTNKDAYYKQQQEIQEKSAKEWLDRVQKHANKVLASYGDQAKELTINKDDTAEVKAQKEKHNAAFKKAEQIANKYLSDPNPENLTEAAIGMGYLSIIQDELKDQQAQNKEKDTKIKALEQQIASIKESGKTGKRITIQSTAPKVQVTPTKIMNDEEAMEQLLRENAE